MRLGSLPYWGINDGDAGSILVLAEILYTCLWLSYFSHSFIADL